jgi:hypothetical protein
MPRIVSAVALIRRQTRRVGHGIGCGADDHLGPSLALRHNAIAKLQSAIAANDTKHIVERLVVLYRII